MRNRSKGILLIAILFLLAFYCGLLACHDSQEIPPLAAQHENPSQEAASTTPEPTEKSSDEPFKIPAHSLPPAYHVVEQWVASYRLNDALSIETNADVFMPDIPVYPVKKLERYNMTQERVDELIAFFIEPGTKFFTDEADPANTYVKPIFTWLRNFQAGGFRKEFGENFLRAYLEWPDGARHGVLSASQYEKDTFEYVEFAYHASAKVHESENDGNQELFKNHAMDIEAAKKRAIQLLQELHIEGMQVESCVKALLPLEETPENESPIHAIPACEIIFTRESGGTPVATHGIGGCSISSDLDYAGFYSAPFDVDRITVLVSEAGVVAFAWRNAASLVETVEENAALLPLEEIKARIIEHIGFMNSPYTGDASELRIRVNISELRLGMAYVNDKDNPEQVLVVPAWFTTAREEYWNNSHDKDSWVQGNTSDVMINALDGVVIFSPGILENGVYKMPEIEE